MVVIILGEVSRIESGHPVLLEHEAARWLFPAELDSVEWLPADR